MLFNDIVKRNHLVNTFKMIFNSYIRNVPGNACKVIFSFQSTMYKKHRGIFQSKTIIFENYNVRLGPRSIEAKLGGPVSYLAGRRVVDAQ